MEGLGASQQILSMIVLAMSPLPTTSTRSAENPCARSARNTVWWMNRPRVMRMIERSQARARTRRDCSASGATNEFAAEAFVSSQRDVGPPFDVRWSNARGTVHASSATWTSGSRVVIDYAFRGSRASEAVHERIAVTIP